MNYFDYPATNKNARINSRIDRTGKLRTETQRRDEGTVLMAISTDERNDSTNLFIDFPGFEGNVRLDGREARTLYRLLRKHYGAARKSRTT
jgi:hypothetical protein